MQVAERDIGQGWRENIGGDRMFAANQDAAFRPFGFQPARAGQMPHRKDRQAPRAGNGGVRHRQMQGAGGGGYGRFCPPLVAQLQPRQIGLPQKGHGENIGTRRTRRVMQRDQMPVHIHTCRVPS